MDSIGVCVRIQYRARDVDTVGRGVNNDLPSSLVQIRQHRVAVPIDDIRSQSDSVDAVGGGVDGQIVAGRVVLREGNTGDQPVGLGVVDIDLPLHGDVDAVGVVVHGDAPAILTKVDHLQYDLRANRGANAHHSSKDQQ